MNPAPKGGKPGRGERWQPVSLSPWSGRDLGAELRAVDRKVDVYATWAELTLFAGLQKPPQRLPLLVQLKPGRSAQHFASMLLGDAGRRILVPPIYLSPPKGLTNSRYLTASVPSKGLGDFPPYWSEWVEGYEMGLPMPPSQASQGCGPGPTFDPNSTIVPPVLVGVIDDGIPFAHQRFRLPPADPERTRFEFFWDQANALGPPPSCFTYGIEFTHADMKAWMNAATQAGDVDEEAVYRKAGYQGVRRQVTHGAHMADCAAGATLAEAPAAPRVAGVQLPYPSVADTSGYTLTPHALDALTYLLQCADSLGARHGAAGPSPLAVDLSYACAAGPHDGSSIFERLLDEKITLRNAVAPFSVVLPAGNHYLNRGHAHFDLDPGVGRQLDWHVLPDDQTMSFVEIWLPANAAGISVSVTPPGGVSSPLVTRGTGSTYSVGADLLGAILYPTLTSKGAGQLVAIGILPTLADPSVGTAPAGHWAISIYNASNRSEKVNVWVERDDTVVGYPIRGRQSYLEDPNYERFDLSGRWQTADQPASVVKRAGSFNGFGTGQKPPVIGGWVRSNGETARYSGGGDATFVPQALPTAVAVADESPVRIGMIAAKSRSGAVVALSGTSSAAAHITRWTAEQMAKGLPFDRAAVGAQAAADESTMGTPSSDGPERIGAGRIEASTPTSARR